MASVDTTTDPKKHKLNFFRMFRSEWIKTFSLRSTWWLLLCTIVVNVGITMMVVYSIRWSLTHPENYGDNGTTSPDGAKLTLVEVVAQTTGTIGQLIFAAISVLIITNEYSSGMIRSTMGVAPRRSRVLIAKMLVIALLCLFVFGISMAAGYSGGYLAFRNVSGVDLSLTSHVSLRIVGGFMLAMLLLAWLSFGLGAWIRYTGGALSAAIGVIFVLPIIYSLVLNFSATTPKTTGWRKWLYDGQWLLPTNAGSMVQQSVPPESFLSPWGGMAVLGGWALLVLIISFISTSRRDV